MKILQEELHSLRKTQDQTRVEHADVVNKLSKSLEESQAQCRQYLQSGKRKKECIMIHTWAVTVLETEQN